MGGDHTMVPRDYLDGIVSAAEDLVHTARPKAFQVNGDVGESRRLQAIHYLSTITFFKQPG